MGFKKSEFQVAPPSAFLKSNYGQRLSYGFIVTTPLATCLTFVFYHRLIEVRSIHHTHKLCFVDDLLSMCQFLQPFLGGKSNLDCRARLHTRAGRALIFQHIYDPFLRQRYIGALSITGFVKAMVTKTEISDYQT